MNQSENRAGREGPDAEALLRFLGLSDDAERLYLVLVGVGQATERRLAEHLDLTFARVRACVAELRELGLVRLDADQVIAHPPREALDARADRLIAQATAARRAAAALARAWAGQLRSADWLEVIPRLDATRQVVEGMIDRMVSGARAEIWSLTHARIWPEYRPRVPAGTIDALSRGVSIRCVYSMDIWDHPAALDAVWTMVAAGEEARVFPQVPMYALIVDFTRALISTTSRSGEVNTWMVVHDSPLLDVLIEITDSIWTMSAALPSSPRDDPNVEQLDRDTLDLLTYLSAGQTDEAIARKLGVSERTVLRRIAKLQDQLAAHSRFQLGVYATRRGWT